MDRQTFRVKDASLSKSTALGNGNAAIVNSASVDLQAITSLGARLTPAEVLLEAPALTGTQAPNGSAITYVVQMDSTTSFASPTEVARVTQATAVTTGATALSFRAGIPSDADRYMRVQATNNATVGDATASEFEFSIVI